MINWQNTFYIAIWLAVVNFSYADQPDLPEQLLSIMNQPKYKHSNWGIYVKDSATGKILHDYNSNQLFLPGSTTKIFTVEALLHAYGKDFRFKTPVFATGLIQEGVLTGDLVLVAQGDPTFGGRQNPDSDLIAFTSMDHIYANQLPNVILTPQNPLNGLNELAREIRKKGVEKIVGNIRIDDSIFETVEKREMILSPMIINDNLIDIEINPSQLGEKATINWRPVVEGYTILNKTKTSTKGTDPDIKITSNSEGTIITVEGTIPVDTKDLLRVFPILNPKHFAREAFIQALQKEGINVHIPEDSAISLPILKKKEPIAVLVSPPISEFAKLILKVSHNFGADLIALLLAAKKGMKTFDEGMVEFGNFMTDVVGVTENSFVFIDAAGGDGNRLTPKAELKLLEYVKNLSEDRFTTFFQSLPILGVDGSLTNVSKNSTASGKVRAKTGTGISYNVALKRFFLTTQALVGYIEGKNNHLLEFMIVVNNAAMPKLEDIEAIFEDLGQMAVEIYEKSSF